MSIVVRFKPTSLTAATYDESTRQLEERKSFRVRLSGERDTIITGELTLTVTAAAQGARDVVHVPSTVLGCHLRVEDDLQQQVVVAVAVAVTAGVSYGCATFISALLNLWAVDLRRVHVTRDRTSGARRSMLNRLVRNRRANRSLIISSVGIRPRTMRTWLASVPTVDIEHGQTT